jgi:hypothetical protein
MPAHSRPKDGVLSHAYVAGIHVSLVAKTWMRGSSPRMTMQMPCATSRLSWPALCRPSTSFLRYKSSSAGGSNQLVSEMPPSTTKAAPVT